MAPTILTVRLWKSESLMQLGALRLNICQKTGLFIWSGMREGYLLRGHPIIRSSGNISGVVKKFGFGGLSWNIWKKKPQIKRTINPFGSTISALGCDPRPRRMRRRWRGLTWTHWLRIIQLSMHTCITENNRWHLLSFYLVVSSLNRINLIYLCLKVTNRPDWKIWGIPVRVH